MTPNRDLFHKAGLPYMPSMGILAVKYEFRESSDHPTTISGCPQMTHPLHAQRNQRQQIKW
eukprot:CAMPEP_0174337420 /NCGR_PEP_ID=MMETSP0810-20121108/22297_1 /TAXON_ID=73025 ORGANISM="Eutreptiella gymnastica-like, Strain CCMP1594" /NCGR_SAMPLE_ID=MMETSP0810 /ASSEMBLY_ACC=CAM_ASM_000659 /LENGTH=60 /DNA_ID=CAMNT_0015456845 /DNA_START=84 /DNA_END=266 /DNA_ORIENTATION=+